MTAAEPSRPQRGQTLDERQQAVPAERSAPKSNLVEFRETLSVAHPREMLAMGNGFPVVLKQILQGFFLIVWPFWAVTVIAYAIGFHFVVYPILYALFWPIRVIFKDKTHDPT